MDPGEFARTRLFLTWGLGKEKILNPFHCEQLGVVEIPNHSMVLEIFKEKG